MAVSLNVDALEINRAREYNSMLAYVINQYESLRNFKEF